MRTTRSWLLLVLALVVCCAESPSAAIAHPHVWVTAKAEVVYAQGKIVAIDHHWTFDEFYTAMAIEGLDKNGDGVYSREELAGLAEVNMQGLKEFDYFSYATRGTEKIAFGAPTGAWLEHKDGVLTLHYRLPLEKPVAGDATGFSLAVYDPSFFIAFEMAKDNPVTLAGAPAGCKITFGDPEAPAKSDQPDGSVFATPSAKAAVVTCGKT